MFLVQKVWLSEDERVEWVQWQAASVDENRFIDVPSVVPVMSVRAEIAARGPVGTHYQAPPGVDAQGPWLRAASDGYGIETYSAFGEDARTLADLPRVSAAMLPTVQHALCLARDNTAHRLVVPTGALPMPELDRLASQGLVDKHQHWFRLTAAGLVALVSCLRLDG